MNVVRAEARTKRNHMTKTKTTKKAAPAAKKAAPKKVLVQTAPKARVSKGGAILAPRQDRQREARRRRARLQRIGSSRIREPAATRAFFVSSLGSQLKTGQR